MEIEFIGKMLIAIVLIFAAATLIFTFGNRIDVANQPTEDFMKYGQMFAGQSEICEMYGNASVSESDFKIIMASIAYSDCREINVTTGFSMTAKQFEEMILDIYPENKAPTVIYRNDCSALSVTSGSYIVSANSGKYLYQKGDNINIRVEGMQRRDVIICQKA